MFIKQSVALWVLGLLLTTSPFAHARRLRGTSTATAVSNDGGNSFASSNSQGNAEVATLAVSARRGTASAQKTATAGNHTAVSIADGDTTWSFGSDQQATTHQAIQHEEHSSAQQGRPVAWSSAPACKQAPTCNNSVKDTLGRLWGFEHNTSCAFKDNSTSLPKFDYDTAPTCPGLPTKNNSVADHNGRLWGWAGMSCVFRASHRMLQDYPAGENNPDHNPGEAIPGYSTDNASNPGSSGTSGTATENHMVPQQGLPLMAQSYSSGPGVAEAAAQAAAGFQGSRRLLGNATSIVPSPVLLSTLQQPAAAVAGSPGNRPGTLTVITSRYGEGDAAVECQLVNGNNGMQQLKCSKAVDAATNSTNLAQQATSPALPTVAMVAAAGPVSPRPAASPVPSAATPAINTSLVIIKGATWEDSTPCTQQPTKKTAVQDTLGRLWWTENCQSCSYKGANDLPVYYAGYAQVDWETAPACRGKATAFNSMSDAQDRTWGWEADTNCKYISPDGTALSYSSFKLAY